jgi:hypothetical protein
MFKVFATIYCDIEKEVSHIPGKEWLFLLV